jgi:hypothetical protein
VLPPYSTVLYARQGLASNESFTPIIGSNTTLVLQHGTFYCNTADGLLGTAEISLVYEPFDRIEVFASFGVWDVILSGVVLQGHPIYNGGNPDESVQFERIFVATALELPKLFVSTYKVVIESSVVG